MAEDEQAQSRAGDVSSPRRRYGKWTRAKWAPQLLSLVVIAAFPGCRKSDPAKVNSAVNAMLQREQPDSAITALADAIAAHPDFAELYRTRARAYMRKGDPATALRDIDTAIRLSPSTAAYYNDRALAHQMAGRYDEAVAAYTESLGHDSTYALARKNRGRVEFYRGNFEQAARDLAIGARQDSTNPYVAIWLHFINKRLGRDDALEFASQIALTDSVRWPAPVARYYLGRMTAAELLAVSGDTDSKAMRNQTCAVHFYFGEERAWQGRNTEAAAEFELARASCPTTSTEYEGAVAELQRMKKP